VLIAMQLFTGVSETGNKLLPVSLFLKISFYKYILQPNSFQTKYGKTFCLKIFSFIARVVDTGD
jgi:hypothetical protein